MHAYGLLESDFSYAVSGSEQNVKEDETFLKAIKNTDKFKLKQIRAVSENYKNTTTQKYSRAHKYRW